MLDKIQPHISSTTGKTLTDCDEKMCVSAFGVASALTQSSTALESTMSASDLLESLEELEKKGIGACDKAVSTVCSPVVVQIDCIGKTRGRISFLEDIKKVVQSPSCEAVSASMCPALLVSLEMIRSYIPDSSQTNLISKMFSSRPAGRLDQVLSALRFKLNPNYCPTVQPLGILEASSAFISKDYLNSRVTKTEDDETSLKNFFSAIADQFKVSNP